VIRRISPLDIGLEPERTVNRNGWEIPLTYVGERKRADLFISDLSHVPKWCLRGADLDDEKPAGLDMPRKPGAVMMDQGVLLVRLISSEARIMALGEKTPGFSGANYTDITDGYATMAVVGAKCFDVLGKLSAVDLEGPAASRAALAPVEELTCLMVRLQGEGGIPGIIISGARGYGHFLLDAFLDAGKQYGIQPAGLQKFSAWLGGAH
jgi:hypothetical protein